MENYKLIKEMNSKLESLDHNKTELEYLRNCEFEEKMNFKSLLKSHTFCNKEEFERLKLVLENIFLNRIQKIESDLRGYSITQHQ